MVVERERERYIEWQTVGVSTAGVSRAYLNISRLFSSRSLLSSLALIACFPFESIFFGLFANTAHSERSLKSMCVSLVKSVSLAFVRVSQCALFCECYAKRLYELREKFLKLMHCIARLASLVDYQWTFEFLCYAYLQPTTWCMHVLECLWFKNAFHNWLSPVCWINKYILLIIKAYR